MDAERRHFLFTERDMEHKLVKVNATQKPLLYRLLQYALFEMSATDGNEMNALGVYEYPWFDLYFTDDDRDAYLIEDANSGAVLGFVMVNQYLQKSANGHSIAEFLILPKFRRAGLGTAVAKEIFATYGGNWEVEPSLGSRGAEGFWQSVIDFVTNGNFRKEDGIYLFFV